MLAYISELLRKWNVDCFAPIPLSECYIKKPYLLEREGIADGTAVIIAVPYVTPFCDDPQRNLSTYAVSKNYHAFFDLLFADILPLLKSCYPQNRFAAFADHSPISEVDAASKAGLGVIGKNHLLLTEKYSSYIFLGELITDAKLDCEVSEVRECENCGACTDACPANEIGTCLSALTQKKGNLTEVEAATIRRFGSVWGCDICQAVCPHSIRARESKSIYTPIAYFYEDPISSLRLKTLDEMNEEQFMTRAFSWRGRDTIRRNLKLMEEGEREC